MVAIGVGVHLIEANVVAPFVMERQINLPPVITIAGVLLIGKLSGWAGWWRRSRFWCSSWYWYGTFCWAEVYGDPVSETKSSRSVATDLEPRIVPQSPPS